MIENGTRMVEMVELLKRLKRLKWLQMVEMVTEWLKRLSWLRPEAAKIAMNLESSKIDVIVQNVSAMIKIMKMILRIPKVEMIANFVQYVAVS